MVHQRAIPNNLLAVEVRKSANHQPLEHDQHKLRALTDPHLWFAYWIGVLLTLGKTQVTKSEVYTSGVLDQTLSGLVRGAAEGCGLKRRMKPAIRRFYDDRRSIKGAATGANHAPDWTNCRPIAAKAVAEHRSPIVLRA